MSHPSPDDLFRLLHQKVFDPAEARAMAEHVFDCPACLQTIDELPRPVLYILGRPLCPVMPAGWLAAENATISLVRLVESKLPGGGTVRISADWCNQTFLYQVLASTLSRLRRRYGVSTHVENASGLEPIPPPLPDAGVCALLEAPAFRDIGDWADGNNGRLLILAGLDEDWARSSFEGSADFTFSAGGYEADVENRIAPFLQAWSQAWNNGSARKRDLLLGMAGGADLQSSQLGELSPDFRALVAQAQTPEGEWLPWFAPTGAWLLYRALQLVGADRTSGHLKSRFPWRLGP